MKTHLARGTLSALIAARSSSGQQLFGLMMTIMEVAIMGGS